MLWPTLLFNSLANTQQNPPFVMEKYDSSGPFSYYDGEAKAENVNIKLDFTPLAHDRYVAVVPCDNSSSILPCDFFDENRNGYYQLSSVENAFLGEAVLHYYVGTKVARDLGFTDSLSAQPRMLQFLHWGGPLNKTSVLKMTSGTFGININTGAPVIDTWNTTVQNFNTTFFTLGFTNKEDDTVWSIAEYNPCLTVQQGGKCTPVSFLPIPEDPAFDNPLRVAAYCHQNNAGECVLHDDDTGGLSDTKCYETLESCDPACEGDRGSFFGGVSNVCAAQEEGTQYYVNGNLIIGGGTSTPSDAVYCMTAIAAVYVMCYNNGAMCSPTPAASCFVEQTNSPPPPI